MVIEHALLPVKPGLEAEFEEAFASARLIIASMPSFQGLTLSRGIENSSSYLLLVTWDSVEAHEVGFRGSPEYQEWKRMLHHFYDPFPVVEHYREVTTA
jgi:heme-degrading monooxygenase HmoA